MILVRIKIEKKKIKQIKTSVNWRKSSLNMSFCHILEKKRYKRKASKEE